jgi:hypothetical protein
MRNKKTKVNEEKQPNSKQRAPKIKVSSQTEPPATTKKEKQRNKERKLKQDWKWPLCRTVWIKSIFKWRHFFLIVSILFFTCLQLL